MGLSQYPRPGFRLAPALLQEVLNVPVPPKLLPARQRGSLKVCELDESVWQRFSAATCRRLSQAVLARVKARFACLSKSILRQRLPKVPAGIVLEDLELEPRTYGCLDWSRRKGLLVD